MEISLEGEEGENMVEDVAKCRYLVITLDQVDDDWISVMQNIMRARLVWGIPGKLFRREGEQARVVEIFYREVVQAILLYGSETWVLLAEMENQVEGAYTGFLRQISGKRARRIVDGR